MDAAPHRDRATPRLSGLGCGATALAWIAGFAPIVIWLATPAEITAGDGATLMGAGLAALFLNLAGAALAIAALIVRRSRRSQASLVPGIAALVLAILGLVGVALLFSVGLLMVAPGVT